MFLVVSPESTPREGCAGFPAASATDFPTYGDDSLSHWPLVPHVFVKAVIVCPYSSCNFLYIFNFGSCDHPLIWLFLDLFIPAQSIDPIDLCVVSDFIHSFIAPCISLVSCVCLILSSRFSSLGFQQGIYLGSWNTLLNILHCFAVCLSHLWFLESVMNNSCGKNVVEFHSDKLQEDK